MAFSLSQKSTKGPKYNVEMWIQPLNSIRHPSYRGYFLALKRENLKSRVFHEMKADKKPDDFDIETAEKTKIGH